MRRHHPLIALIAFIAMAAAACSPAATPRTSSVAPSVTPQAPPSEAAASHGSAGSPAPTLAPSPPPGTTAWPKAFDVAVQGTYWSSPPFRVPFQITVAEAGWFSAHLHADFIDFMRFDDRPHQFPNRMVGLGDPDHIRGGDGAVSVTTLTPGAALDLLAPRASLTTSNRAAQELFGLAGARLDLRSATNNNPLFGGEDGDFGLGPELDVRLVLLPLDGRLLAVVVLAEPGDLDAAWDQALPILETVQLAPSSPS